MMATLIGAAFSVDETAGEGAIWFDIIRFPGQKRSTKLHEKTSGTFRVRSCDFVDHLSVRNSCSKTTNETPFATQGLLRETITLRRTAGRVTVNLHRGLRFMQVSAFSGDFVDRPLVN